MNFNSNILYFIGFNFIFSFLSNILLIPNLITFGKRLKLYDKPDRRKIHLKPIVFTGGLSIFLSSLLIIIINIFPFKNLNIFSDTQVLIIFLSSFLCLLIGFLDDIYKVSPWPRLIIQIIISSFVWAQGIAFKVITIFEITYNIPNFLSYLLTILWITAIINAFNWIDGIDGLAAGISIISLSSFFIIFFTNYNFEYLILISTLIGGCLGFLKYNFYPAKLIMGDGGSYFLGFNIACIGIISTYSSVNNIYVPILLISIPIFDMIFVLHKRLNKRQSPFFPDNNHIHHRLIKAGLDEKSIVIRLYWIMAIFSIIGISFNLVL